MADVVVDMKPMEKLPYDPNDIPEAVRKRAAAVDALYKGNGQQQPVEQQPVQKAEPTQQPPEVAPTPQVSAPTPDLAAPSAPAPAELVPEDSGNLQSWKDRANTWQGRYNASQKTVAELQEQMTQLGNELLQMQRARSPAAPSQPQPQPPPVFLTPEDEQQYGRDLIEFTQRAAAQVVAPHLQEIERRNQELQRQLARETRRNLDLAVAAGVPNYQEIDRDPRWHNWLLGIDVFSGRVRQQLLDEAIAAASAPRVISFFKGFLQEEVATGHIEPSPQPSPAATPPRAEPAVSLASLAAPGRVRPATGGDASLPPDKPFYTRANIRDNYAANRKGAFVGREAEWNRLEQDMIAAGREGRIRQ